MSTGVRLRQAVAVAHDLDGRVAQLRDAHGLAEGYEDPNVALFGLRNRVMAVGDCFLEVVSPMTDGTAAGRHLERLGGDGGYMLIFQLDDLDGARTRAADAGVRTVWSLDLEDISGTHLHPADTGGTIVSLDRADPPGSWRWAGPEWIGGAGTPGPGALRAVTVEVADPAATATLWGHLLGVQARGEALAVDGATVSFTPGTRGLVAVDLGEAGDLQL